MVERAATIRDTVDRALNENGLSGYASAATPVVTVLEEREVYLADLIVGAAVENGYSRADALGILRDIGMQTPSTNGTGMTDDGEDRVTRIEHSLTQITDELRALREERANRNR